MLKVMMSVQVVLNKVERNCGNSVPSQLALHVTNCNPFVGNALILQYIRPAYYHNRELVD